MASGSWVAKRNFQEIEKDNEVEFCYKIKKKLRELQKAEREREAEAGRHKHSHQETKRGASCEERRETRRHRNYQATYNDNPYRSKATRDTLDVHWIINEREERTSYTPPLQKEEWAGSQEEDKVGLKRPLKRDKERNNHPSPMEKVERDFPPSFTPPLPPPTNEQHQKHTQRAIGSQESLFRGGRGEGGRRRTPQEREKREEEERRLPQGITQSPWQLATGARSNGPHCQSNLEEVTREKGPGGGKEGKRRRKDTGPRMAQRPWATTEMEENGGGNEKKGKRKRRERGKGGKRGKKGADDAQNANDQHSTSSSQRTEGFSQSTTVTTAHVTTTNEERTPAPSYTSVRLSDNETVVCRGEKENKKDIIVCRRRGGEETKMTYKIIKKKSPKEKKEKKAKEKKAPKEKKQKEKKSKEKKPKEKKAKEKKSKGQTQEEKAEQETAPCSLFRWPITIEKCQERENWNENPCNKHSLNVKLLVRPKRPAPSPTTAEREALAAMKNQTIVSCYEEKGKKDKKSCKKGKRNISPVRFATVCPANATSTVCQETLGVCQSTPPSKNKNNNNNNPAIDKLCCQMKKCSPGDIVMGSAMKIKTKNCVISDLPKKEKKRICRVVKKSLKSMVKKDLFSSKEICQLVTEQIRQSMRMAVMKHPEADITKIKDTTYVKFPNC